MTQLDAEDEDRMERLDRDLLRRRIEAVRALRIPRGTADGRFVAGLAGRRAIDLSPAERHQVVVICWTWRRRGLERGVVPKVNPADPFSADRLALHLGCGPTLARARVEMTQGGP